MRQQNPSVKEKTVGVRCPIQFTPSSDSSWVSVLNKHVILFLNVLSKYDTVSKCQASTDLSGHLCNGDLDNHLSAYSQEQAYACMQIFLLTVGHGLQIVTHVLSCID